MLETRHLRFLDWRLLFLMGALMGISLLILSATDPAFTTAHSAEVSFFTPKVVKQLQHFILGGAIFFLCTIFDYNKLREWTPFFYVVMIFALFGLFFTHTIQNVQRWYRIPVLGMSVQPSEYAKLIMVLMLSFFLERHRARSQNLSLAFQALVIMLIPFALILKQPDLGTALVLCPITLAMFYLGNIHPRFLKCMLIIGIVLFTLILLIFTEILSYEKMRPFATKFLKEYQYERLDPHNHHQKSALIAIGVGGWTGTGWRTSSFTGRGWLPYGYTDSVFAAFAEEFGLLGLLTLLLLYLALIYLGFRTTNTAKDYFGRMLASGITIYFAMHVIVNIGMMCGFLPITGVPLLLLSYGGSSVIATMAALGLLQSIYTRRFMF